MTREDERDMACTNWICSQENGTVIMAREVWKAAVKWADSYPNWISVEDELPPFTHPEGASVKNTSDYVLAYNGYMVYISRLVGGEIKWWEDNRDVHPTHWMPLPQLPRKEDK